MEIKESEIDLFESVESLIEKIQFEPVDSDTQVFVLKIDNKTLGTTEKSYNLKILGKSILEWTKSAFGSEAKEIETDVSKSILEVVLPHLNDKKWTGVFYADTPLLKRKTFLSILDYAQTKQIDALKLERGYVFKTEFLKSANNLSGMEHSDIFKEDFFAIFNMTQLEIVSKELKSRILSFHKQNGVQILDDSTTFIDADVEIGKDVIIFPNNVIMGNTEIGDKTIIEPFCTIKSSKIGKNCKLKCSYVENTNVLDGTRVTPFQTLIGEEK